jgi:hypothetical protein
MVRRFFCWTFPFTLLLSSLLFQLMDSGAVLLPPTALAQTIQ